MTIALIFVSANGTTEKVTEFLNQQFEENGHVVKSINLGRPPYRGNPEEVVKKTDQYDVIGLGSPVYHMDMLDPMRQFLKVLKVLKRHRSNNPEKAFIYLTYSGITTGKAFINSVKTLNNSKIDVIGGMKIKAPHFHHKDDVLDMEKCKQFTKRFCDRLEQKHFDKIPFQRARSLFSPEKKRVNILFPLVHVVGKLRELPINIDESKCKKCRKCERECPAGAIKLNDTATIDFSKCLHCYHCVNACPFHAIESPIHKIDDMIKVNKSIVGMENPSNNIYV